jgi:aldose sugar dehydrogenase
MRRPLIAATLALLGGACRRDDGDAPDGAAIAADRAGIDSVAVDTIATGLEVPWALAFAADGRMFVTERAGRIRVVENGRLRPEPWATLPVAAVGEAGLMGIAIPPDFAASRAVYVVGTFRTGDAGDLTNRVMRLTDRDGHGVDAQVVLDRIPAAQFHAGDAIAFGPDGALYVATGDARSPGHAQDETSLAGKILRLTTSGAAARDNPRAGSLVYAMGLRNVQGLAWNADGQLFATEHGPSGFPNERFRRNNDELNAIRSGANYGWPSVAGSGGASGFIPPLVTWSPAIVPSGIAVYRGDEFPSWRGALFVGALRGAQLRRVAVARDAGSPSGWRVVSQLPMFDGRYGRIRAVTSGTDGRIYFTTSNRDGRGSAGRSDDMVLRLRRAP